jgi:hypothetical protein
MAACTLSLGTFTFAFFSDAGSSNTNTFSTGTLDLKLTDADETSAQDNVTASFGSASPLAPGQCLGTQVLKIRNSGTVPGTHLVITTSHTDLTFADNLRIDELSYDGVDKLAALSAIAGNTNTIKDLHDLQSSPLALANLSLTNLNSDHTLAMKVCLDDNLPNTAQGGSDSMIVNVMLTQAP